jgi:hypothetical protein
MSPFRILGVYSVPRNYSVPFLFANRTQEWALGAEPSGPIPHDSRTEHTPAKQTQTFV